MIPERMPLDADMVVYMLDLDGDSEAGPYLGSPGLDFAALSAAFRSERFAAAEAERKDYCFISSSDFPAWLIEKGVVTPMRHTSVSIAIDTTGDNAYQPAHWPMCPACGEARGEPEYGDARKDLNRVLAFNRCLACRFEFGHRDEPNDERYPMLEDDGRYIVGGCVPYALSRAGELPIQEVIRECRTFGWREESGMHDHHAIDAAAALGLRVRRVAHACAPPTLRRVVATLDSRKRFVVATTGHWLAVVNGEVIDNCANTHARTHVRALYEVERRGAGGPAAEERKTG